MYPVFGFAFGIREGNVVRANCMYRASAFGLPVESRMDTDAILPFASVLTSTAPIRFVMGLQLTTNRLRRKITIRRINSFLEKDRIIAGADRY